MNTIRDKADDIALAVGATFAIPLGTALLSFDAATLDNPGPWLRSLIIGCALAVGAQVYRWGKSRNPGPAV